MLFARLVNECHFFKQMVGVGDLVDDEEDVADVKGDVAADLRIEDDVAHGAFPYAVEVEADEVSVGVDHRAAGVAAGGVVLEKLGMVVELTELPMGIISVLAAVVLYPASWALSVHWYGKREF